MAPTSSRLILPIPADIVMDIALYLPVEDQHTMLLSSWATHDIVAPLLYRSIEMWLQPPSWTPGSEHHVHRPFRLLAALARSARHLSTSYPTRFYPGYIVTLAYISYSPQFDLRALPMLADVLRFTNRLRHIRVELTCQSVELVLDVFSRRAVIRAPVPALLANSPDTQGAALVLPSLRSIRSSRPVIVESLMRLRKVTTAVIDTIPSVAIFNRILMSSPSTGTSHLTHLSITFCVDHATFPTMLRAIAGCFPLLVNLFVRTGSSAAESTLIYILEVLAEEHGTLPQLRAIGVNYGRLGLTYLEVIKSAAGAIQASGEKRFAFTAVAFGMSAFRRRDEGSSVWVLQAEVPDGQWSWVMNRACRHHIQLSCRRARPVGGSMILPIWYVGYIRLLPFSEFNEVLTYVHVHLPQAVVAIPVGRASSLSVFELFLLSSDDSELDAFFARLSPNIIMRIRRLSSSSLHAVDAYCNRRWDIDVLLGRWFRQPSGFLYMLDACHAVVSGSEVLRFFGRHSYVGYELDIYAPWSGVLEMGRWLKGHGYVYQASADKHPLFDVAVMMASSFCGSTPSSLVLSTGQKRPPYTAFSFVCPHKTALPTQHRLMGSRIQLIAVRASPERFIIDQFHSTGFMNYFTGTYAVSLFPRTTFVDNITMVCQDASRHNPAHVQWMAKYAERGLKALTAQHPVPRTLEARTWRRRIGDQLTWVLPFAQRSSVKRTMPVLSTVLFEVLTVDHKVAPAGALLRVGPRFKYSSLAVIANPWLDLGNYRSIEIDAAFVQYYQEDAEVSEDELIASDDDSDVADG
ncbi:hypothetical protein C2E23DRAFT_726875 [Lenzites betulinus]|nr:hypothetical protein C2E23DRAFT_726875 [Lenzites betulinus]